MDISRKFTIFLLLIILTINMAAISAASDNGESTIEDIAPESDTNLNIELQESDYDNELQETSNSNTKSQENNAHNELQESDYDNELQETSNSNIKSETDADDSAEEEIQKNDTIITSNSNKFYYGAYFKVTLKDNSSNPVKDSSIVFKVNGENHTSISDENGTANLNIKLSPGTYSIEVSYDGNESLNPYNKTFTITVLKNVPKITTSTNCVFRGKYFHVYLKNATGSALKNHTVYFKLNGKTYKRYTDDNGRASLKITTKTYKNNLTISFKGKGDYAAVSKTITMRVKINPSNKNSIWVWTRDMKKVPFSTLKKNGIKNIFIHENTVYVSGFKSWLKKANKKGFKVHIWMQCFYNGKTWPKPCSKSGKINTALQKKLIKKAKTFAGIKGVSGINLDYIRFGATAPKYKNAEYAITLTVKKLTQAIKSKNKNCIVSSSVMADGVESNVYYYGQNLTKMSEYVDVIVPMAYKGNYKKDRHWIKNTSSSFKKAIGGKAQLWVGLQAYRSDNDIRKWSKSALTKDIKYAFKGGADGIVLFRYGLTRFVNIPKIKKSIK